MARNVEIKAAVPDLAQLQQRIQPLATSAPVVVTQDDTFFPCSTGRLKLREFEDGAGELIFYRRADSAGPKTSFYVRTVTAEPALLRQALVLAYGEVGRVRKQRTLHMIGRTRVHVDRVEGLGDFLELEVVLADGELAAEGIQEAQRIAAALGVAKADLREGAYLDLLARRNNARRPGG